MKAVHLHAMILLAGISLSSAGNAADLTPLTPEAKTVDSQTGWEFTLAPYFWAAGISGDTGQFGLPEVHLDADFGDILKNLDFAFMATGEARYDRFSIVGDVIYTKLGAMAIPLTASLPTTSTLRQRRFPDSSGAVMRSSKTKMDTSISLAA